MRIVGLGIDAVEIARIEGFLRSPTRNWAAGIFSAAEREHADEAPRDARYYASRFAAKEAVSKALGTGMAGDETVHTIEILRLPSGAPTVNIIGGAKEAADALGIKEAHQHHLLWRPGDGYRLRRRKLTAPPKKLASLTRAGSMPGLAEVAGPNRRSEVGMVEFARSGPDPAAARGT